MANVCTNIYFTFVMAITLILAFFSYIHYVELLKLNNVKKISKSVFCLISLRN